jgi:hypothetical protein
MTDEWVRHTDIHWSRKVCGKRLDYWPTTKRFSWNKETMFGDPEEFIARVMEEQRKLQDKVISNRFEKKAPSHRLIMLDCGHTNSDGCEGVQIKTPNGPYRSERLCHSCAMQRVRDDELETIVNWLKCQARFGLPNFVISYLEGKRHR